MTVPCSSPRKPNVVAFNHKSEITKPLSGSERKWNILLHQTRLSINRGWEKNSREIKQAATCINGEDRTLKLIRRTFRLHRLTLLYLNLPISYSNFFSIDRTRKIIPRTLGKTSIKFSYGGNQIHEFGVNVHLIKAYTTSTTRVK